MNATRSLDEKTNGEISRLFVYGALMRGFDLHHYLAGCRFQGEAWVSGTLVSLGHYPGVIEGNGKIVGELYLMSDPPSLLEALDELEQYDPLDPQDSEYIRTVRVATKSDGSNELVWMYLYNRNTAGLPVVASGDWRKRA